ncbi:MAG: hypothetical protein SNJ78_09390, partial [Spirochaetales bacterium]
MNLWTSGNSSEPRRNPLAILFVSMCLLMPVLLAYDITTPLVFFSLNLLHLLAFRGIEYSRYLKTVALLSLVGAGLFLL